MKVSDFDFDLPDELIAHYPAKARSGSRLLELNATTGAITHRQFPAILDFLDVNDLLVVNNTKVIPARFYGHKASGGKLEFLVERVLSENEALLHIKSSRSPKEGSWVEIEGGSQAEVLGRSGALFRLRFEQSIWRLMDQVGHMPLPPYIERNDEASDALRYQTVYAVAPGAVAAPTAGLHFDEALLGEIKAKGVNVAQVTLHVGAGTFQPVKVENILDHRMHSEYFEVTEAVCQQIQRCREVGGRVVAVGTTSVRTLESLAKSCAGDPLRELRGETDIFIYPGYQFQLVDAMVTNFHLPKSTLLMLVSAFAGTDHILNAYREAVAHHYRFFSYGDAMLLHR